MKANETKKPEVKKPVETVKPVQQVQHRQKRNFYLYNEVEGKFLMSDRTFPLLDNCTCSTALQKRKQSVRFLLTPLC